MVGLGWPMLVVIVGMTESSRLLKVRVKRCKPDVGLHLFLYVKSSDKLRGVVEAV